MVQEVRTPPIRTDIRGDASQLEKETAKARAALDRYRRQTRQTGKELGTTNRAAMAFGRTLRRFAGPAAIGVLAAGLTRATKSAAEYGQQLFDTSILSGISISDMQALARAGRDAGASFGQIRVALQASNRQIGEASRGIGEARYALNLLGLDARDLIKEERLQQLAIIFERISRLPTVSGRQFSLQKLFGEGGALIAPLAERGAAGLAEFLGQAEKAGELSAGQVKGLRDLNLEARALTRELTNTVRQLIAIGADDIRSALKGTRELIQDLRKALTAPGPDNAGLPRLIDDVDFLNSEALRRPVADRQLFKDIVDGIRAARKEAKGFINEIRGIEAALTKQLFEDLLGDSTLFRFPPLEVKIQPPDLLDYERALRAASDAVAADIAERQRIARQGRAESSIGIDAFGGAGPSTRIDQDDAQEKTRIAIQRAAALRQQQLTDQAIAGRQKVRSLIEDEINAGGTRLEQLQLERKLIFATAQQAASLLFIDRTRQALITARITASRQYAAALRDNARFEAENNLEAKKGAEERLARLRAELDLLAQRLAALKELAATQKDILNATGKTGDENARLKTIVDGSKSAFVELGKSAVFEFDKITEALSRFAQRLADLILEAAVLRPLADAIGAGIGSVLGITPKGIAPPNLSPPKPGKPPSKGPKQLPAIPNLAGLTAPAIPSFAGGNRPRGLGQIGGTNVTVSPTFQAIGSDEATARRVFQQSMPEMVRTVTLALQEAGRI